MHACSTAEVTAKWASVSSKLTDSLGHVTQTKPAIARAGNSDCTGFGETGQINSIISFVTGAVLIHWNMCLTSCSFLQERAHKHALQRVVRADAFALEHKRVNEWDLSDAMATFAHQYRQELRYAVHVQFTLYSHNLYTLFEALDLPP